MHCPLCFFESAYLSTGSGTWWVGRGPGTRWWTGRRSARTEQRAGPPGSRPRALTAARLSEASRSRSPSSPGSTGRWTCASCPECHGCWGGPWRWSVAPEAPGCGGCGRSGGSGVDRPRSRGSSVHTCRSSCTELCCTTWRQTSRWWHSGQEDRQCTSSLSGSFSGFKYKKIDIF